MNYKRMSIEINEKMVESVRGISPHRNRHLRVFGFSFGRWVHLYNIPYTINPLNDMGNTKLLEQKICCNTLGVSIEYIDINDYRVIKHIWFNDDHPDTLGFIANEVF